MAKQKGKDTKVEKETVEEPSNSFGNRLGDRSAVDENEEDDAADDESDEESDDEGDDGDPDEEESEDKSEEDESEEAEESGEDDEEDSEETDDEEGEEEDQDDAEGEEEAEEEESEESETDDEAEKETESEQKVPVSALQAERKKFRDRDAKREQEIATLKKQLQDAGVEVADPIPNESPEVTEKVFKSSVKAAKASYKDFDAVYETLEAFDAENPDRRLMDIVRQSEDPGEMAYELGQEIEITKKYGKNWSERLPAIEKELREKISKEMKDANAKSLKTKLQKKAKEPKNISGARSSKGTSKSEREPKSSSFGSRLRR